MKSKCCGADVKVVPENAHRGQTCYYECQKCMSPCDFIIEETGVYDDEDFIKAFKRVTQLETAKNICILIDEIELSEPDSTLAEWKQYKHIRNAIRDFYGIVPDRKE